MQTYLHVECRWSCEELLEQSMELLGEDQCVWTERVPAERRASEVSDVLHFTQAGAS